MENAPGQNKIDLAIKIFETIVSSGKETGDKEEVERREVERCNLYDKLLKIKKAIEKIAKDGKNDHARYSFISHNKMTEVLREQLIEHDIFIATSSVLLSREKVGETQNGANIYGSHVQVIFKIIDKDSGYTEIETFPGFDQDSGGKDTAQAITEATKRFYFKYFKVVEEADDPDTQKQEAYSRRGNNQRRGNYSNQNRQNYQQPRNNPPPQQNPDSKIKMMEERMGQLSTDLQKMLIDAGIGTSSGYKLGEAIDWDEEKIKKVALAWGLYGQQKDSEQGHFKRISELVSAFQDCGWDDTKLAATIFQPEEEKPESEEDVDDGSDTSETS